MSTSIVTQFESFDAATQMNLLSKMRDEKISIPLLQELGGNVKEYLPHADSIHSSKKALAEATKFVMNATTINAGLQRKILQEFSILSLPERIWKRSEYEKKFVEIGTEKSPIITEFYDIIANDATYQSTAYLIVTLFVRSISAISDVTDIDRLRLYQQLQVTPFAEKIFIHNRLQQATTSFQKAHHTMITGVSVDRQFYFSYLVRHQLTTLIENLKNHGCDR
jgi:hypothetical protein